MDIKYLFGVKTTGDIETQMGKSLLRLKPPDFLTMECNKCQGITYHRLVRWTRRKVTWKCVKCKATRTENIDFKGES